MTRLNDNAKFTVIECFPFEEISEEGVIKDAKIALNYQCPTTKQRQSTHARLIAYVDPETGNKLTFVTNLFDIKALTVCLLYKHQWVIEPLFKQLKKTLSSPIFIPIVKMA